jgi:hypothetical protein
MIVMSEEMKKKTLPPARQAPAEVRENRGGSPKHMKVLFMAAAFPP